MPVATASPRARRRLLGASERLLVGRFSYGITPALARQVAARGGARAWFEWQLTPGAVRDPDLKGLDDWWPGLRFSGAQAWKRNVDQVEPGWVHTANYQRWLIQRRLRSRRQLLEVMTELWEHHFNVPANGDPQFVYRKAYGDTIRKRALGSFEALLKAAVTHPSMLIYLNQAVSTKDHPNENLGRELLELHTVGRGHHTEDDVKNCARVLTGYRVDLWNTWEPSYQRSSHWTGPVTVLGFTDANASTDGQPVADRLLSYLAHHPATAQRVARKLAVKFVSDDPPQGLVDRLAQVYLAEGTQIRPVLRALVDSAEFKASAGQKIRNPVEDVIASYRALGVRLTRPTEDASGANAVLWQCTGVGVYPHGWPRPDGLPQTNGAWATPARMMGSMRMHYTLSGGWWPKVDTRYRRPASWAPDYPIRFDDLVDHLARRILHRRATPELLQACCQATGVSPGERITRDHGLVRWGFPRLLVTFLDTPDFYAR